MGTNGLLSGKKKWKTKRWNWQVIGAEIEVMIGSRWFDSQFLFIDAFVFCLAPG